MGAAAAAALTAAFLVSGGQSANPKTPPALPGHPAPFLGTVVLGGDGIAAALDGYGNVVDLRLPAATGEAQIDHPAERLSAGSVERDTGIVLRAGGGRALPLWRAQGIRQRHLPGTNVAVTRAWTGGARVRVVDAASPDGPALARVVDVSSRGRARLELAANLDLGGTPDGDTAFATPRGFSQSGDGRELSCAATPAPDHTLIASGDDAAALLRWRAPQSLRVSITCAFGARPGETAPGLIRAAARSDRRWLASGTALGPGAPAWARRLHDRSLLVLRALSDRHRGGIAAGARDNWSYVWPRDAATAALALDAAGHRREARRVVRFLHGLDLATAARFYGDGSPVTDGRDLQGDAAGWIAVASDAVGLAPSAPLTAFPWRDRGDYGERAGDTGDYLANAIAAGVPARTIRALFGTARGLERAAGLPASGLDAAAAWAVEPFGRPALRGAVRRTLGALLRERSRYGIQPAESWPGDEPWTAPTAWTAWALAAAGQRREALELIGALRRAATPAGTLPERVDRESGVARSTTPLGWSHAFAVLALGELFPAS
jgi:hypothetical protein